MVPPRQTTVLIMSHRILSSRRPESTGETPGTAKFDGASPQQRPLSRTATDTRSRILVAADAVFSTQGVRAGSVDRIAAGAGVTKRTLYYHFRSKDDLIAAWLSEYDLSARSQLRGWMVGQAIPLAERFALLLEELGRAAENPRWRGCGFLQTAFELAELPGHPARLIAAMHKRRLEEWLASEMQREGLPDARERARSLMLVLDGAVAQLVVHRDAAYARHATALARTILSDGVTVSRPEQCETPQHSSRRANASFATLPR